MPIPVHIVGGFLGTGKTTLIRDQLEARPGEQLAVIVNDFGGGPDGTGGASEPARARGEDGRGLGDGAVVHGEDPSKGREV